MRNAASTQGRSTAAVRSRQTTPGRSTHETAKTPVLFRFPIIEKPIIDKGGLGDPASVPEAHPVAAAETAGDIANSPETAAVVSRPVEHTVERTSAEPKVVERVRTSDEGVVTAAPISSVQLVPARSWWDHWASGLLLILLIIALVAISIVAFTDSGSGNPALLADAKQKKSQQFALGEFTIPDTVAPSPTERSSIAGEDHDNLAHDAKLEPELGSGLQTDQASMTLEFDSSPNLPVLDQHVHEGTLSLIPESHTSQGSEALPEEPLPAGVLTSELLPEASLGQPVGTADPVATLSTHTLDQTLAGEGDIESAPLKTATLLAPEISMNPTLVPPSPSLTSPGTFVPGGKSPTAPSIVSDTGKRGRMPYETPETLSPVDAEEPGASARPLTSQAETPARSGASPSLYDGAELNSTNQITTSVTPTPNSAIPDTRLPSYQSLLVGNAKPAPTFATASHGATDSTNYTTASQKSAVRSPGPEPTPGVAQDQGTNAGTMINRPVVETGTPNMDAESLIRAYQTFRRLNQSETTTENRYLTNPRARQPSQPPTGATGLPYGTYPATAAPRKTAPQTATTRVGGAIIR